MIQKIKNYEIASNMVQWKLGKTILIDSLIFFFNIRRVHIKLIKFFHDFKLEKHQHKYKVVLILVIIKLKVG